MVKVRRNWADANIYSMMVAVKCYWADTNIYPVIVTRAVVRSRAYSIIASAFPGKGEGVTQTIKIIIKNNNASF